VLLGYIIISEEWPSKAISLESYVSTPLRIFHQSQEAGYKRGSLVRILFGEKPI